MLFLFTTFSLALAFFSCSAYCDTKFARPPEIYAERKHDWDVGNNIRYSIGDAIQISWESSVKNIVLSLVQVEEPGSNDGLEWMLLDSSRTEWEAEYDAGGLSKNEEDSIYAFALWTEKDGVLAQSLFFNVSAPEPKMTETSTSSQTTTTETEGLSTADISTSFIIETTTRDELATAIPTETTGEDVDTPSMTKLSQGETAGAAVGGTLGGLLIFGCIGWLLWRKLWKGKGNSDMSQPQRPQTQVSEPKAELPGDHGPHLPGYARSPTGVYEAP